MINFYYGSLQAVFPPRFESTMLSQLGIVTILSAVFLCDTAAYFIGSLFGTHHFSTISPNKTIEGALAGFVMAVIVSVLGWHFFADTARYPLWMGLVMGVLIGIFAQLGDLLVSLMKRYFRVKDASNIIPGHGGILDRFDSVFFTAPIVTLFLMLLTRMAE
jgi:phosphatidate cytidylyltransferase